MKDDEGGVLGEPWFPKGLVNNLEKFYLTSGERAEDDICSLICEEIDEEIELDLQQFRQLTERIAIEFEFQELQYLIDGLEIHVYINNPNKSFHIKRNIYTRNLQFKFSRLQDVIGCAKTLVYAFLYHL